jgi:hypothetical protein
MISRTSSTPVRLAASISWTSVEVPAAISVQAAQAPQGSSVGPSSQFKQQARIRASVVLPVPLGPVRRMAWGTR